MTNEFNIDDFSFARSNRVEGTPEHRTYEVLSLREFQRLLFGAVNEKGAASSMTVRYQPIQVRTKGNVYIAVSGSGENEKVREIVVQDTRQHLLEASYEFRSQGLLIEEADGFEEADFPRCVLKLESSRKLLSEHDSVTEAVDAAEAYIEGLVGLFPVSSLDSLKEAVLLYEVAQ